MLILRNARIVPELTEGYEGDLADIVIDEGVIQDILPPRTASGSEESIMDMTGMTVIPGLIEAHLHLDLSGMDTFEENVQPDAYRTARALSLAMDNLRKGYTTVRDVGDRNNIIIDLARAVNEGLVMGPDILASGKIISPTEKGNEFFGDMYLEADSEDEFVKAVRTQYQRGADWIKIMGTGAIMNPGGTPGRPIIYEDELKAACRCADYVGLPVSVHCHGSEGIKMCIRSGVRTIEHSSIMDDECIRMYKESNRTFMIPTISAPFAFVEFADRFDFPQHYVEKSRKVLGVLTEGMRAAYEAGVKMGWGTDAGVYPGSHGNGFYEFELRVERLGFSSLDTLIQATRNNSEILLIDDQVGTIKPGKRANLVACLGEPDQDYRYLNNIKAVFKKGKLIK